MCPPLLDLTDLDRHALKELAFMYHYGAWRSAEEAKKSISGQAAAEMARRGGYELPEPFLMTSFKKTLAIDFDGVLHGYSKGWQEGVIYDPPKDGAKEALASLSEKFNLVVFTTREDLDAVGTWLETHELSPYITSVTNSKPLAVAYIDDRAVRFENWVQVTEFITTLED
jgi:hypothetical protein